MFAAADPTGGAGTAPDTPPNPESPVNIGTDYQEPLAAKNSLTTADPAGGAGTVPLVPPVPESPIKSVIARAIRPGMGSEAVSGGETTTFVKSAPPVPPPPVDPAHTTVIGIPSPKESNGVTLIKTPDVDRKSKALIWY
jgi:hypothetical protein